MGIRREGMDVGGWINGNFLLFEISLIDLVVIVFMSFVLVVDFNNWVIFNDIWLFCKRLNYNFSIINFDIFWYNVVLLYWKFIC